MLLSIPDELCQAILDFSCIGNQSSSSLELLIHLKECINGQKTQEAPLEMSEYIVPTTPKTISKIQNDNKIVSEVDRLFMLFHWIGSLKRTKRTGWLQHFGIPFDEIESVSDHMYRMAIMSMLLARSDGFSDLDLDKCVSLALIHDLAEAIIGDIPPGAKIPKPAKHSMELEAMHQLSELVRKSGIVSDGYKADFLLTIWKEYESQSTREARFVKDLDRFEMLLQAYEYEIEHSGVNLEAFFISTRGSFRTEKVQKLVEHLEGLRSKYRYTDQD
jgi:putative hydrolase of HD superfamily